MRLLVIATIALCAHAVPVLGQTPTSSHWGVVGGFAPKWENTSTYEPLVKLVFDEDAVGLLRGSEFRIGIARGRHLSGDWGVSFIRKRIDDSDPTTVETGRGCQGGGSGILVLDCEIFGETRTPRALLMNGVEVHKYIAFVTIKQRVQIGLNLAGGVVVGKGGFTNESFTVTYKCTFPPGQFPDFSLEDDPCYGGAKGPDTITPTEVTDDPFTRLLNYKRNQVPIGKVEIAGTVIVTPQLKVRIGGGMNFPGQTTIGLTGIYFFGND
jgi:hypothetical protein